MSCSATGSFCGPVVRSFVLQAAEAELTSGRLEATLARRIAYRTESHDPGRRSILRDYLTNEIGPAVEEIGMGWALYQPPDAPCPFLIAERIEDAALMTVLSYGHGDVTPGEDDRWSSGRSPWKLVSQDGAWYGRGSSDNKGQHSINLAALKAVFQAKGRFGFNLKLVFEMGEEIGSPGLRALCLAERAHLSADLLIASDASRAAVGLPTLVLGTRGGVTFELTLSRYGTPLHPGPHGGGFPNPAVEIANAIACLVDGRGRIRVASLVPRGLHCSVREVLARMPDGGPSGSDWGEPGLTHQEKIQAWSSLDVLAMAAGDTVNPGNSIPASAWARLQLRFPIEIDKDSVIPAVSRHLAEHGFGHIAIAPAGVIPFGATRTDPNHPWVRWAMASLEETLGTVPAVMVGGSAPSDVLEECLGLPALWIPHGDPDGCQHAPDEHLPIAIAREGLAMMAGVFFDLGETGRLSPRPATSAAAPSPT